MVLSGRMIFDAEIMVQAGQDVFVGPGDDNAVAEHRVDGGHVDRVQAVGPQHADDQHDDRGHEVHELRLRGAAVQVPEPQDVRRVVVGMHHDIGPLVDGNGDGEDGDAQDTQQDAPGVARSGTPQCLKRATNRSMK